MQTQSREARDDEEDNEETVKAQDPQRPRMETRRTGTNQERDQRNLAARLFRNVMIPKKKTISISMKNTLLWNPSPDPDNPNHAFFENIIPFLNRLSQLYVIYLVCPVSSIQEKEQILTLLRNAQQFSNDVIDERRVLFCETEEGKIHIIRHLETNVHVEGGMNGEECVEMVRSFVDNVIWLLHGDNIRNGTLAESSEIKSNIDRSQWTNVEVSQNLWTSSLSHE
ncbi:3698_t:CDS:2 [Scutellospora calospora]|uniref:3698_t:CDS:1 n=1 Tax=Scutellospora calospora TaxID=85575 RepID=A0ACA9JVE0_9GLOM|nr:3698_t:CDS:2 [Scutellospora calospora]